jgi:transposase
LGNRPDRLVQALSRFSAPRQVCFEAGTGAGYLRDFLREEVEEVLEAHPAQLRWIWGSKRKTDRLDAERLARLALVGMIPRVHVPESDVRSWRSLIEYRRRALSARTRAKNGLHALLKSHGKRPARSLWSQAGLAWLGSEPFAEPVASAHRDLLLEELASAESRLSKATSVLNTVSRGHRAVQLLQTIPGVGARTAEAVAAYVDDAWRFGATKRVGSYFGLVPSQDQSGAVDRRGRITRQGPSVVRWLLTESAWQAIRYSPTIQRYYARRLRGDAGRRKLAAVATAHYLARVMVAMLKSGTPWREAA